MSEKQTLIDKLPELLVSPERFGGVALATVVQLYPDLPETRRHYGRPLAPDSESTLQRLDRLDRL